MSATATSTPPRCTRTRQGVGQGIRDAGVDRGDVFITSKLNNGFHRPDDARRAFDGTLEALGFDYVDLFLIHWPLPTLYDGDFVSTWQTLEEFKRDGRARSIGVSNFQTAHLERLAEGDRHRARGEPDRGTPVLRQRRGARLRPEARHRHGGVVADRAGQGARRPRGRGHRRRDGQVTGAGGVALAHSARRHRVPEVGHTTTRQGELRDLRLRAERGRRRRHQRTGQGRKRPHRDPTPTSSTTSPTDRRRAHSD